MCGIAGYIDFSGKAHQEALTHMTTALQRRGPDDEGFWHAAIPPASIGLGHRRLSIIDLSANGRQPMHTPDGRWHISFNGEIYNYQSIRTELQALGYHFISQTDTEVILHAFDCWGNAAIHRFTGMFAFALFDQQNRCLHLYRDRGGAKPLYYYRKNGLFLFASELKALYQHPEFQKTPDSFALRQYFSLGHIPAPLTPFQDTFKLPAGHTLTLDLTKQTVTTAAYWEITHSYQQAKWQGSDREAIEQTEHQLRAACRWRMVADVPAGIFLSGGYDSSLITAMLQSEQSSALHTFCIGFEGFGLDETPYARQVADHLGTRHHTYYCTAPEALDIVPQLPDIFDEPLADVSAIPLVLLSRLARQEVKVALTGDAADELFGGYTKYNHLLNFWKIAGHLPYPLRRAAGKALQWIAVDSQWTPVQWSAFLQKIKKTGRLLQGHDVADAMTQLESDFDMPRHTNPVVLVGLDALLCFDYQHILCDDFLVKTDRASMYAGLEAREPYLDHHLAKFVARLPAHLKIRNGQNKWILRQITHRYLPKALMERPKVGFNVPIGNWLRNELRPLCDEYLSEKRIRDSGFLTWPSVQHWRRMHHKGHVGYERLLWKALVFEMWYERHMRLYPGTPF